MNNGDSFHNGAENLELQRKNRLGEKTDAEKATANTSPTASASNANPTHLHTGFSTESKNGIPYYGDETADASPYQDYTVDPAVMVRKNRFNVASLVLGIASLAGNFCCLTCLTPIAAILAIIFGCVGRINGRFEKKGLIGMVLGIVYWGLLILFIVGITALMAITDSAALM